MRRRNAIDISVKGLVLAVVVIIALVLSAISLYMVSRSKSTINDGNTQYAEMMSDYSEINATIYDGLYVSGDKVIEVIKDCSADLNEGVQVLTLMNTGKADGTDGTSTKDKYDQYKSGSEYTIVNKSNNSYINPTGTFVGSVDKNANGMVTSIIFRQIN